MENDDFKRSVIKDERNEKIKINKIPIKNNKIKAAWIIVILLILIIAGIFVYFNLSSKPRTLGLIKNQPENIQKGVRDVASNVKNINDLLTDEKLDKVIELVNLQNNNLKVTDKKLFKEGALVGIKDGENLNDLNEDYFTKSNINISAGYGFGYSIGCMFVKKDTPFCQNLMGNKINKFFTDHPNLK